MTTAAIHGSCLCGAVQYEATEVGAAAHCHCSRCRKWHGAAFASVARAPIDALRVLSGAETLGRYASSPGVERCFCKVCGSSLFTLRHDVGRAHVRLGTVDGDPGVRPSRHAFVGSKAPWFEITDSLPQHHGPLPSGEPPD
ncbi:MAG TPA: GFA family protein [Polyangiaceae bacterium]|nr:GFA family protein [Polyangiaceae bacterium]